MTKRKSIKIGWWSDLAFKFFRIPKVLIEDSVYETLSPDAALLYGLLLDRACLSEQTPAFHDPAGGIYVVYTIQEICKKMCCGHDKASKLLRELEKHQLVRVNRSRKNKRANQIYVLPFQNQNSQPDATEDISDFQTISSPEYAENQTLDTLKTSADIVGKPDISDTESSETDSNDTIVLGDVWSEEELVEKIKIWIGYENLKRIEKYRPYLDPVVEVMKAVFSEHRPTVRVGKKTYPRRTVCSRLCRIDQRHLTFVLESITSGDTGSIKNLSGFLLAYLFHAPIKIQSLKAYGILNKIAEREELKEVTA